MAIVNRIRTPSITGFLFLSHKFFVFVKNTNFKINLNRRHSRTAIFSAHVADKKLVQQTTYHFYTRVKLHQKHLDRDLAERIQADCFRD